MRSLKDKTDNAFGQELHKAAVDGKITEVSYMFPRPGEDVPVQKVSFVIGVSGIGCGVGYFKSLCEKTKHDMIPSIIAGGIG